MIKRDSDSIKTYKKKICLNILQNNLVFLTHRGPYETGSFPYFTQIPIYIIYTCTCHVR